MLATLYSAAIYGIDALPVTVEVSVTRGLGYQITGLPDESIKESLSRIAIAIQECGFQMPRTKLLIHLGPANVRKSGSAFDLPIALGILLATGQIEDLGKLSNYIIAGEIGLDARVNPVPGALCMSELSVRRQYKGLICPVQNAREAALIKQADVYPIQHLKNVLSFIQADFSIPAFKADKLPCPGTGTAMDFKNVAGQHRLKRAMEIAAAGGHHMLIRGFPGSGKSLLAKCLPSILPPMTEQEILETTRIRSLMLKDQELHQLITERPFCEIHPTISEAGLIGGTMQALPGQITAAHNGILFMDEFSEFKASVLDALRQPLEERRITVARSKAVIEYPAAFMLVAAMNPCACGYHRHPTIKCRCSKRALWWHYRKISGPILDRFDLCVEADHIEADDIFQDPAVNESSIVIRQRVIMARKRQLIRHARQSDVHCNAQYSHELVQQFCKPDEHAQRFLRGQWEKTGLSMRGLDKTLKVARTIANLAGSEQIELSHIAEALSYRFPIQAMQPNVKSAPAIPLKSAAELPRHIKDLL